MEQRSSARQRGYDSKWQRERAAFLAQPENQFCERCKAAGILNPGHLRMDGPPQTNRSFARGPAFRWQSVSRERELVSFVKLNVQISEALLKKRERSFQPLYDFGGRLK